MPQNAPARTPDQPRRHAAGGASTAHVRADPGGPARLCAGRPRHGQAHVRTRQGHPPRQRHSDRDGVGGRLGGGGGLRHPQGSVLRAGDLVHAAGDLARCSSRRTRGPTTPPPGRGFASCSTGPTAACSRASPRDRSRPGPTSTPRDCSPSPRRCSRALDRSPSATRRPRVCRPSAGSTPSDSYGAPGTGTSSASTASATTCAPSDSRGSRPTFATPGRGASLPAAFGPPITSTSGRGGPASPPSEPRSPSRRTSRGGRPPGCGMRRSGEPGDDGWVPVSVPTGPDDALASWVLGFGPDVRVVEPASLREEVVRRLEALLAG